MRRRDFITLLGGAAAWPLGSLAQQPRPPTIGYLGATTSAGERARTGAFVRRLAELGWVEGRTVAIEYRWAEGRPQRYPEMAAELVHLPANIIVPSATAAALACKQATSVIPIVFPLTGDPIGTGLVASLARPGGNVTGLTNQASELAGKRLEFLREIAPGLRRVGTLANRGYPGRISEIADVQAAARALGVEVATLEIGLPEEISAAFGAFKERAEAVYVVGDTLLNTNRYVVASAAINARLPTIYPSRETVEAGGLMSYGANIEHLFRRAAELVDKILRGAKPSEIPVEQPTSFELVINLRTAKALGMNLPPTLLALADEVIE
jgi:putative tryptophan/tyrosine transport system substrate-binding protein